LERSQASESGSIPVQILSPFDHATEALYLGYFRKAVLQDYRELVLEALQRIDPAIAEVEVLPTQDSRAALYLRHERSGRTPVSAFGDGVRRVLLMALALPQATNGNLLIDEIETAIHVSVLGEVFTWLVGACKQRNVQLFATTHSLEALDAILAAGKDHPDEIVAYRFPDPARPGPPKRYAGDQLHRLRYERGLDVR
ncbi:MAG: AAA family ATPase, partial [Byssovorax sp.]